MQERKRDIILQNMVERAQAIEIKKSQFYLLFGYSTEKLKVTSATKQQLLKISHLRYRLQMSLVHRKVMFRSHNIQVFVFLTSL